MRDIAVVVLTAVVIYIGSLVYRTYNEHKQMWQALTRPPATQVVPGGQP